MRFSLTVYGRLSSFYLDYGLFFILIVSTNHELDGCSQIEKTNMEISYQLDQGDWRVPSKLLHGSSLIHLTKIL